MNEQLGAAGGRRAWAVDSVEGGRGRGRGLVTAIRRELCRARMGTRIVPAVCDS